MIDAIYLNFIKFLNHPFTSIISSGVLILFVILYLYQKIQRRRFPKLSLEAEIEKPEKKATATVITSQDIKAIAGEDTLSTQLDLARAYIELNKKKIAKQILDHVLQHGDAHQQKTATQLLTHL